MYNLKNLQYVMDDSILPYENDEIEVTQEDLDFEQKIIKEFNLELANQEKISK